MPDRVVAETGRYVPGQLAYLQLIRTASMLGTELGELLAQHGVSGKQYNALRSIRRAGPSGATVTEIEADMVAHEPDTTRLVDRLEQAGHVERRRDAVDRRVVRVALTAKGEDLLSRIDEPLVALHVRQFERLTAREIETLIKLLIKVRGED